MKRARLFIALLMALTVAVPFVPRGGAAAHPLGNFTINRYARIEVYRDTLLVHYVLDFAEIPSFRLKQDADLDRDDRLSAAELDSYAGQLALDIARNIELTAGDRPVTLEVVQSSGEVAPGQGGLDVVRLAMVYRAPVTANGTVAIRFVDQNLGDRPGWREIVVRPSAGARVDIEPRFLAEQSGGLRDYPSEELSSAPTDQEVTLRWEGGTGAAAPAYAAAERGISSRPVGRFESLLDNERSLGIILLSLLAALGFGALHALGPGHGKSMVGAYLVGSRGTARHAVGLGLTVTATHTSTVYLLGFATLSASAYIAPDSLYLYLGVASGAMIVLMGLVLFVTRLRAMGRAPGDGTHRHGLFGRAHSHVAEEAHHEHGHGHEHPHAEPVEAKASWRSVFTLGVAGGLLPCPSAIIVMLSAISLGQVVFGMFLIVAFSLGLAGVLTAIGLGLVWGKRLSGRTRLRTIAARPGVGRALAAVPVVSALGVAVVGAMITYQAWNQPL
jgi:ABC-type nickel/cobalt efflux system permease component RcnA